MSELKKIDFSNLILPYGIEIPKYDPSEKPLWRIKAYNDTNGYDNMDGLYDCPKCLNKGFIAVDVNDVGVLTLRKCDCREKRKILRNETESGLNKAYSSKKFETKQEWQKKFKQTADEFCVDDTANCFLAGGQSGSGKTQICMEMSAYYINKGLSCKCIMWDDKFERLKRLLDTEEYGKEMDALKNVDVLYIDDFWKTKHGGEPSPADVKLAFYILNYRLLYKDKITIISSEFTIDDIFKIDEAIGGRIRENAKSGKYCFTIGKDKNKNYRLNQGA